MLYEASHDETTELTHGNLTVRFLRCILPDDDQEGPRRGGQTHIWSAEVRAGILERSSDYFRQHGYEYSGSAMYWIDFSKGGSAVKVKASSMKLRADRAKQYRIMLRRYVDKVWRLRNQRSCSPAPSLSRRPKLQLFSNENYKLKSKKEVFEVYIPLTAFSCLSILSSDYLCLNLCPAVRQHVSAQLSDYPLVIIPLVPFKAVKILLPERGIPFIASFSGEDSVATYMPQEEVNGHVFIRENEEAENILPSIAMRPIIDIINNLTVTTYFGSSKSAEAPSFENEGEPILDALNLVVDDPTLQPLHQPEAFTASADGRTTADAAPPPAEDPGARCSPPSTDECLGRCDEYSSTEIITHVVPLPTEGNEILYSPSTTDRRIPVECGTVHKAPVVTPAPILQRRLVGQFLHRCRHANANEDSASIKPSRLPLRLLYQQPGTLLRQRIDEVLTRIDLSILQPSRFYCSPSILRTLSVPPLFQESGTIIFKTPTNEYETMHSSTVAAQPTVHITACNTLPSTLKLKILASPPLTSVEGRGFKEGLTVNVATVVALPYTLKPATAVVSSQGINPTTVYDLTPSKKRRTLAWSPRTCVDIRGFNECRSNDLVTDVALSYTFETATAVASSHGTEPATMNSLTSYREGRVLSLSLTVDADRLKFNECRTVDLATAVASSHGTEPATMNSLTSYREGRVLSSSLTVDADRLKINECRTVDLATVVASPPTLEPATAVALPHNVEHAAVYPPPPTMECEVLVSPPPTSVEKRRFDGYQTVYPATVASPPPTGKTWTVTFPLVVKFLKDSLLAFTAPRQIKRPFTDAFRPSNRQFLQVVEDKRRGNPRRLNVYAAIFFRNFKPFFHWKRPSYFLRILLIVLLCCVIFYKR